MKFVERYIIASLDYIGKHYWTPLVGAIADAIKFHIQSCIQIIEWITKWIRGDER